MNEVIAIDNPSKPAPSGYEYRTHACVALGSRAINFAEKIVRFADVTVDVGRRRITRNGETIEVSITFSCSLFKTSIPLTRDAILNAAWGYDSYPCTRTVDAHVCRLRQKFEPNPAAPRHFLTIHGIGYRFLA